jgi:two-component system response regulator HydG|tara:strand:+ start:418 stop:1494 length:1077 start_codon:yes stop_codon:yes gene_type:complete
MRKVEAKIKHSHNYSSLPKMIGSSEAMSKVYIRVHKIAPTESTVLIRGETGTGKELVAQAIHELSARSDKPFIAINCAAIPETLIESELFGHEKGAFTGAASKRIGLIEAAQGGTLFLDEIGELPSEAQARLLRFIQEKEIRYIGSNVSKKVDVRLIAATHKDLKKLTHSNLFRADLYYRINVIKIDLPRLTDRGNDLLEIAEKLLDDAAIKYNKPGLHLSPNTISSLKNYSWPGNIRELQNVIERSAIMTETQSIENELLELDIETEKKNIKNTSKDNNDTELFYMQNISTNKNHKEPLTNNNEELSLEDYFQRFVLDNQEHMNETELAKKLGISRKCLWERRQRFAIPRNKSNKSN